MKGGFTLLEVVLALALLSALVAGSTSWLTATRDVEAVVEHARWRTLAERAIAAIATDLQIGDGVRAPDRVSVVGDELRIRGRRNGVSTYRFSKTEGLLRMEGRPVPLLGEVADCTFEADVDGRELRVTLIGPDGRSCEGLLPW